MPSGVVLAAAAASGSEPPLVELLGDEAADVRVEAERPVEEDTAVRRDRRFVTHQVAEHRRLAPVGMRALEHLVELLRVADEHRRPGGGRHRARIRQRDLAGLVDEEEVEALLVAVVCEQPGRPADDVAVGAVRVVEDVLDDLPRELRLGVPAARLLHALELQPTLGRGALDLGEELVDRAVARRGDADTLPFRDEPRDQPSGRPGLPGAGRALDHEMPWDGAARRGERLVAAPDREQQLGELVDVGRLDVAAEAVPAEDRLEHGVPPASVEQRPAEPLQRLLLRLRRVDVARDQRPRERHLVEHGAALQLERARVGIVVDNLARAPARRRVDRRAAELLLLRRVREREDRGLLLRPRLTERDETADRLRVLDELLRGEVEPVEEGPPERLALAVVVVEELRRELLQRVAAVEQRLANDAPRLLLRLHGLRLERLGRRERAEPRERLCPPLEQPVAEHARRDAVLAVVCGDRGEDRVVALDHPALELDDRRAALADLGGALEADQVLDLLEPVARPRDTEAALHDLVEVDEHLAAQQVVELGLTGAVAAHHPPERRDLVLRVVVDVQVGVLREPGVHLVDERLEGRALPVVVGRPPHGELVVRVGLAPEVLEAARVVPERVALEVEEEIARRRIGQQREPGGGLEREELVLVASALARDQLQPSLATELRERLVGHPGWAGLVVRARERGERGDVRLPEPLDLPPLDPGDPAEVVDRVPVRVAPWPELADPAPVDRERLGRRRIGDEALEPPLDAPLVGGELLRPERLHRLVPEQHVDPLRSDALQYSEPLAVEAELQDVRGLRVPRELRVESLVGPRADLRRRLHPDQEVRDTAPAVPDECRLVDDVDAGAHCGERLLAAARPVALELDRGDGEPLRAQAFEVGVLVLEPLAEDERGLVAGRRRLGKAPLGDLQRQCGEVLACKVRRHVGRRQPDTTVEDLHDGSIRAAAAAAYARPRLDDYPHRRRARAALFDKARRPVQVDLGVDRDLERIGQGVSGPEQLVQAPPVDAAEFAAVAPFERSGRHRFPPSPIDLPQSPEVLVSLSSIGLRAAIPRTRDRRLRARTPPGDGARAPTASGRQAPRARGRRGAPR